MSSSSTDEYGKPPDYVRTTGPVDLQRALGAGEQTPVSSRVRSKPVEVES